MVNSPLSVFAMSSTDNFKYCNKKRNGTLDQSLSYIRGKGNLEFASTTKYAEPKSLSKWMYWNGCRRALNECAVSIGWVTPFDGRALTENWEGYGWDVKSTRRDSAVLIRATSSLSSRGRESRELPTDCSRMDR